MFVQHLNGMTLMSHRHGRVNVPRVAEEAGCGVDGNVHQQRRLDAVWNVVFDVRV